METTEGREMASMENKKKVLQGRPRARLKKAKIKKKKNSGEEDK